MRVLIVVSYDEQGNMKQHMMTHKNRDGTPISVELLNSVNSRSRSGGSSAGLISKELASKNRHQHHQLGHSQSAPVLGNHHGGSERSNLATLMMLGPSPAAALKEHCLSLTIQHNAGQHNGADGLLPLKEQNASSSPSPEVLLGSLMHQQQQQRALMAAGGRGSPASSAAASAAKKRGKLQQPMTLLPLL